MVALVLLHTPYVNGASYWHWGWQRLSAWRVLPGCLLAALPFVLAQLTHNRRPERVFLGVALLMLSGVLLELNSIFMISGSFSTERLWQIVEDVRATSYYADASLTYKLMPTLGSWFVAFPEIITRLHMHSQTKPPGPMLYYMFFIANFPVDNHQASILGGFVLGLLSASAIPAVYFLARALGGSRSSAFLAASAMTIAPTFTLFFPEFDQLYASLSALLVGCWVVSLQRNSLGWSSLTGALLSATVFLTFSLLVLGLFMAGAAVYISLILRRCSLRRIIENALVALACVVLFFWVL